MSDAEHHLEGNAAAGFQAEIFTFDVTSATVLCDGCGAEGPVAFLHPRAGHGVLIELIEARGGPAWSPLGYDETPPLA